MEPEKSFADVRRPAFATRAIHAGQTPDPTTGAVMTPIYATSTYTQQSPGVHKGFEYSRTQNPTRFAFERCVADLEEGKAGFAFASGLAATATVLELLEHGSHMIVCDDLYGRLVLGRRAATAPSAGTRIFTVWIRATVARSKLESA